MGVAVLPPQDCFSPANKSRRSNNFNPNRHNRKRRYSPPPPPPPPPSSSYAGPTKVQAQAQTQARPRSPPVIGQIRILKRGEDLPVKPEPVIGPEPVVGPDGFYAGSAFVTSPPPSSLPLPAFFTARRNCAITDADVIATGLRRLLKMQ